MHFVDISIIVAFLVATLYIGFSSGKKIKTFGDYAIGSRKFSDFAIFCTICATIIGGATTMGNVGKFYEVGVVHFLAEACLPLSYIIVGTFLAFRFGNYYGCFTLGDMFYKPYGTSGKVLVGVLGTLYGIFGIGSQFIALGTVISILTKLSYPTSLLIGAGVILIYTGRGGIRAVTFTDVLQFMILILALPILAMVVVNKIGGVHALFEQLPQTHVTFSSANLHRYMFLILPMMIPTLTPLNTQRLLMTSYRKQGMKAYYNVCWLYLFIFIMTLFLGLAARVLFPGLARPDQALLTLIANYLPVGIFGMSVIGILAVLMSTADPYLNGCSILIVNDIIIPYKKHIKKRELSESEKIKLARNCSLFMGISGILFAYFHMGLFEARILVSTFWFSVILSPLYFLLFNMKVPLKGLFTSAIIGFSTAILWTTYLKPITNIDGLFPGFFANAITIISFYLLGGRQKVFSKKELEQKRLEEKIQAPKRSKARDLQTRNNVVLGICLVFLQLMPLVLGSGALTQPKLLLMLVNGTLAILLIFGGSLEIFAKEKYFQWLKWVTLFFCLPVTSAYLFLSAEENGLHGLILLFSFIVMLSCVEKKHEVPMGIACFLTAFLTVILYFYNNSHFCWPETFAWQHSFYVVGYVAVLFLLRSNLNLREQEKYRERYTMARSLSHDLMSPLIALRLLIDHNKNGEFDAKNYQQLKNISREMESYVENFILGNLKDGVPLKSVELNESIVSCIEKQKILSRQKFDIQLQAKGTVFARVDAVLFRRIINNLLKICTHALPQGCKTVIVSLEETPQGKAKVLLQAAQGHISAKLIQSMFTEDQKLGDEIDLGISFREFQDIVTKWHGKLEMITHDDDAFFQMIIPCEKQ